MLVLTGYDEADVGACSLRSPRKEQDGVDSNRIRDPEQETSFVCSAEEEASSVASS